MRGIGFLRLAIASMLVIVAVVPVYASTISYAGKDTTTLGSWRTAAPDADSKYGTDGYVMFNYGYGYYEGYTSTRDTYAKPDYISGYAVTQNQGEDGQGNSGPALQNPADTASTGIMQIYNYPTNASDPAVGNLIVTFTMAADKQFNLALYAGHGDSNLSWTQSLTVGIGGASDISSIETERAGVWQIFNVDAKSGDVVTITANCQSLSTGMMLSAMAFDPVPEPSTIVLLVMGLLGIVAYAWRKRR